MPAQYQWVTEWDAEGTTEIQCVEHTTSSGATSVPEEPAACVAGATVPEVFATIQDAVDAGDTVTATYATDGHPTAVTISYAAGDGFSMSELSFTTPG